MANDKEVEEEPTVEVSEDEAEEPTVEISIEELVEKLLAQEDAKETLKQILEELFSDRVEIEKLKEEAKENLSSRQRLQADFDNFRRQSENQKKDIVKFANENLISKFLDSYEDLGRALESSTNYDELKEGVELINNKLRDTLEKEGLKEIPAEGEKFDPFKHEALLVDNVEDVDNGYIIEELMKGYTLKDKVIKYSKVKVCKK